jgi:hypothetical protein
VNITAGGLTSALTATEKSTITNLTITGTVDARDFKTMRDEMLELAILDIGNVVVAADQSNAKNSIPYSAFYDYSTSKGKKSLSTVTLPSTITTISSEAFKGCGVSNINFPPSLTNVGDNAFQGCPLSVNIPATLTWIGTNAFLSCGTINVEDANPNYSSLNGVLFNKDQTTLIQCNLGNVNGLGYTIPSTVKTIGYYAFAGTENLTYLTMPNSVTAIGGYAFAGCRSLRQLNGMGLNIPSSVTSLGSNAFEDCSSAYSVVIPPSIKNIPYGCFRWCVFSSITISSSVTSISNQAFYMNPVLLDYFYNSVKVYAKHPVTINGETFGYNKYSYTLYVPPGCSYEYSIAPYWKDFGRIREFTGFSISENTVTIGSNEGSTASVSIYANTGWTASSDQTWLKVSPTSGSDNQTLTFTAEANPSAIVRTATVTVSAEGISTQTITIKQATTQFSNNISITPGSLSSLFTYADLDTITHLTLKGTIDARDFKIIRDNMPKLAVLDLKDVAIAAYIGTEGTEGISSFEYPANAIPNFAFYNLETYLGKASLTSLKLPTILTSIGNNAFNGCSGLTSFTIPSSITLINISTFSNCTGLETITIPSTVNSIGDYAFMGCMKLNHISIPSSVTAISRSLFSNCTELSSILIPSSITSIGDGAFSGCMKLDSISIPTSVSSIGEGAFEQCQSLSFVILPKSLTSISNNLFSFCSELTSISIPASVSSIGEAAFMECNKLSSIQLPHSVNTIGSWAFEGCVGLNSISTFFESPVDLSSSFNVFMAIDTTKCSLQVPFGSIVQYETANQWKDFTNIIEMPGFKLSATTASLATTQGSKAMVEINSNTSWTVSSNQTWLTVNKTSGTGNNGLTFTAEANPLATTRTAIVTVSATDVESQMISIVQQTNDLKKGLVAYYPFNGNANDESGNGNNGIVNGATLTKDRFGKENSAYNFNGIDNWIEAQQNESSWPNEITVSVFVYPSNENAMVALGKSNPHDASAEMYALCINHPAAGTHFSIKQNSNCKPAEGWKGVGYIPKISSVNWHHVVAKYNNKSMKLFIDGELVGETITTNDTIDNCLGAPLRIGAWWDGNLLPFDGKIDDVRVYNRALNNSEIDSLYHEGGWPINTLPVANAGADQTVNSGATVTLDGSASSDADNDALTYLWTAPAEVTLSSTTVAKPTFTAPEVFADKTYIFSLEVNDGTASSVTDEVIITVKNVNKVPVANAGTNQTVDELTLVTLNGTASDPDAGDVLIYKWTAPSAIKLSSTTVLNPTFTAPEVWDATVDYTLSLVVNDGTVDSPVSQVVITVKNVNKAPIANAGADQSVNEGATVTLDGSKSSDTDFDDITYKWTAPTGITLSSTTVAKPTFTASEVTADKTYTFSLVVNDGTASSVADEVIVTVKNVNKVPVANAGVDQSVNEGANVSLDGSASSDADGQTLTYLWTAPAEVTLSSTTVAKPTFTAPEVTADKTCTFSLVVNDGTVDSPADEVIITVKNVNKVPVANAGADQTVNENSLVTLDGSLSSDADGQTITYLWTAPDGITLSSATAQKPSFTVPEVTADKTYTFSLVVNDGTASSVANEVIVTVKNIVVARHFTPVWTGNGVDHENINISSAKMDGVDLEAGDEVGIFDGTICVGVGTLTGPIIKTNTLNIAVSKNEGSENGYTAGNAISYKLYDKSQDFEYSNVSAVYDSFDPSWSADGKFTLGATAFVELTGLTKVNQNIALNTGWNIISANVIPDNLNLKDIFQSLIDAGRLKKVMDEAGKTIENFGAYGGWKNNIGNLNTAKGYKVNVTAASTLSIEGIPVSLPFDIALNAGWNIISYPSATAQDAKALFQTLIETGKLKKVMDEAGKTIENFGAYGGWKNNIGNFLPGKGYKVNVTSNCTLTIPANGTKAAILVPEVLASTHFVKAYAGNGTDQMSINLINLQASGLQAGDEIGVFDDKLCVGSATVGSDQLMEGSISIPVSANDGLGESPNGFVVGNRVSFNLYRDGQTYPLTLTKLEGSDIFDQNASLFAQVSIAGSTGISAIDNQINFRCYPNPFSEQITIEIQSTSSDKLEVNIYDMDGKLVRKLYSGKAQNQGVLVWDGRNDSGARVVQGTYLINANGRIEKVVLKN